MALDFLQTETLRIAPIAVHDEGHVPRDVAALEDPQADGLQPTVAVALLLDPRHLEQLSDCIQCSQ